MIKPVAIKYVCIHGHFYQPPRENPWLDVIEREDSAAPCHDWNERIHEECYRANTAARFVDEQNRILSLHNNYKCMSFNFGPTLLRWMERYDPSAYRAIIGADKESCERFQGHGNAIAQAYNHLIMPLASRRDKVTQVLWGVRDFEWRFGRRPEGMWLPEAAVDRETLEVMAEAGIKFTVLSPFQAGWWRSTAKGATWQDARGGSIPTGRAYRYLCRSGKVIHIFFYDASLAKGIAFERLLDHSSKLLAQIDSVFGFRDLHSNEPWLVHTATDGESYGHHFKFGDMALAAACEVLEKDPEAQIINYAAFLNTFPVRSQVEILENTAWSCAHGLGRWEEDCGCHIGGEPGWTQEWRAPLREALNRLCDALAVHYEREMGRLSKDPWAARDDYIDVLLDGDGRMTDFLRRHMRTEANPEQAQHCLKLLEMQRHAMSMFTSCGWFFDEVSGIETAIVLRSAARAIQLAEQTGAPSSSLESPFLKTLAKAPSNLPHYKSGADVYLKNIKPVVVEQDRVVANYAIESLTRFSRRDTRIYAYDIIPEREEDLGPNPAPCLYGHVRVGDDRTIEEADYIYAVLHFEGLDFRCSVKPYRNTEEYESILAALQEAVEEQNTVKLIRILDEVFGTEFFNLRDVFRDLRRSIALEISERTLATYTDFQRHLYQTYRPLLLSFRQWDIRVPTDLRVAVRRVLSDEISQIVREIMAHEQEQVLEEHPLWEEKDFFYRAHTGRLRSLLHDARSWGVALQLTEVSLRLGRMMLDAMTMLKQTFSPEWAGRFYRIQTLCRDLAIKPELWKLQTLYFDLIRFALKQPGVASRIPNFAQFLTELDNHLECRFARFFTELTTVPPRDIVPVSVLHPHRSSLQWL